LQPLGEGRAGLYTALMLDLYRLLAEHPTPMLRAIAASWQVALDEGDNVSAARQLGDAMLAPGALSRRLEALSAEARETLALLAREGGRASVKSLALRSGELRRIGPAALERERPWEAPTSPLEELYYNGLVFRGFGPLPGGHGEVLLVPREVLERLPAPTPIAATLEQALAEPPAVVYDDGLALSEDILAVLCHLRRVQPSAEGMGHLTPPAWLGGEGPLAKRLVGPPHETRLTLLWRLLWRLKLIHAEQGRLTPALAARDWLRARDVARAGRLFRGWREDPHLVELTQVPTLVCDPDGCPHDPTVPRRNLATFLRALQPSAWYSIEGLVQALKRHQPTFLRPDGDMNAWFIRDATTEQYLRGPQSWEAVEGQFATYLFTGPLRWLGLVRLGGPTGGSPTTLALSTLGAAVLGKPLAPEAPRQRMPAQISPDGLITVSLVNTAYERYQLERIAQWQGQDRVARYGLTEDTVWEGYNAGISVPRMVAFLTRIGGELPPSLALRLQAWSGRFGRATIRQATLLVLADEATAQDVLHDRQLSALISESLSPTMLVVRPGAVEELTAALKAKGIWPQRLAH